MSFDQPTDEPDDRQLADMVQEQAEREAIANGTMQGGTFEVTDEGIFVDVQSGKSEPEKGTPSPENWRRCINLSAITSEPPSREWILPGWLSAGMVASLYGAGGVGKTLLGLQIGVCVALGERFLGMKVKPGRVLILACEDDEGDLATRMFRIARGLKRTLREVHGRLFVQSRVGLSNALVRGSRGEMTPTELLTLIDTKLAKAQATGMPIDVLMLDNIAQMLPVLEGDRSDVTSAVNLLSGIAVRHNCAVLLLGHRAKDRESTYSGSTAWDAAVRARVLLEFTNTKREMLKLSIEKTNYAKPTTITLRFDGDLFLRADTVVDAHAEQARRQAVRALIVQAVRYCGDTLKVEPSDSQRSDRCLWKVMEKYDLLGNYSTDDVKREVATMVKDKALRVQSRPCRNGKDFCWLELPKPVAVVA